MVRKDDYNMGNRMRELRKNFNLQQEALGATLGTTQQAISRMETASYDIPSDLLIKMAELFNVTTDYILGISDVKREQSGQMRMDLEMDKYYDIVLRFQRLDDINRKTFKVILERLEQAQQESNSIKGA